MYKKISKSDKIIAKLKSEGKVRNLNTKEDLEKNESLNKYMEEVRREYIIKNVKSEISAMKVIINS